MKSSAKSGTRSAGPQLQKYFAALPPRSRRFLKTVRAAIRAVAPESVESFSYGIPGFKVDGKPLVWYAAWKNHASMYPMTPKSKLALSEQLENYEVARGTIRFPLDKDPPIAVVKRIVKARVSELRSR